MAESTIKNNQNLPYLRFIGGGNTYLANSADASFLIFGKRGNNIILDVVAVNLGAVQKKQFGATDFITYSMSNGVLRIATDFYTQTYALCEQGCRINEL